MVLRRSANPALKYYFEMLGLPVTASGYEVLAAYAYFQQEQAPGLYAPGSADQKKAEERQAELKFAYDKLAHWFKDDPGGPPAAEEHFRFDGNAEQWQKHQALLWEEQLKEYRAQESEVWTKIQDERKRLRVQEFIQRTKVLATVICVLAFAGESWHGSWNKQFRHIQAENLMVEARGDFMQRQHDPQVIHDNLMDKAYKLRDEWVQDDNDAGTAVIWTWIMAFLTALAWLPKNAWTEIKAEIKADLPKLKKVTKFLKERKVI